MLDCQKLPELSERRSEVRMEKASRVLGATVVSRIVAFALYLLGASRRALSEFVRMPSDTVKSLTHRVLSDGLPALEDRRRRRSSFLLPARTPPLRPSVFMDGETLVVKLSEQISIKMPRGNKIQCRTMLLTFLEGGLLGTDDVAKGLGLSRDRVRVLAAKLREHDAPELIDQRRGAQRDTRVTPEVRAELIQQYVLNAATDASTSSRQLGADLEERCEIKLSGRTIRHHVAKLGLRNLARTLRQSLSEAKKRSTES